MLWLETQMKKTKRKQNNTKTTPKQTKKQKQTKNPEKNPEWPIDHVVHLRNQPKIINTFKKSSDYIITFIRRGKNPSSPF